MRSLRPFRAHRALPPDRAAAVLAALAYSRNVRTSIAPDDTVRWVEASDLLIAVWSAAWRTP